MSKSLVAVLSALLCLNLCYLSEGAQDGALDFQMAAQERRLQRIAKHRSAMSNLTPVKPRLFTNPFRRQIDGADRDDIPTDEPRGLVLEPLTTSIHHSTEHSSLPRSPPSTPHNSPLLPRCSRSPLLSDTSIQKDKSSDHNLPALTNTQPSCLDTIESEHSNPDEFINTR